MEDLTSPQLTAGGIVALVAILVITGRLQPWWAVRERLKELQDRIAKLENENAHLRDTLQTTTEAALMQARAQIEQLEMGRTQDHFINAMQLTARRADPNATEEEGG